MDFIFRIYVCLSNVSVQVCVAQKFKFPVNHAR